MARVKEEDSMDLAVVVDLVRVMVEMKVKEETDMVEDLV